MAAFILTALLPLGVASSRPNIVFLIDESTDGRTYRPDFEVQAAPLIGSGLAIAVTIARKSRRFPVEMRPR